MRKPFIAGNWKMNTTVQEAMKLVRDMLPELNQLDRIDIAVCPPFVSLVSVHDALQGSMIRVGAQNMYFQEKGAYTGEVSPLMLQGLCSL
jgi:triosephosphate isomerase